MDAKKTAQQVLEQVGGAENVTFLTHCVTRLRFNLKSMDGVDEAKVKAVPGVVGVVNKGGQYQVIIGNEVAAVYDELMKLGDFGGKEVKQPAAPAEEKKSRVSIILDTLAGVFTPLMPLIAGAGMIKALLSVLTLFGWIDKSGNLYYFLNFIADSSYYFLPIFLANSAAKKFGCNPQMAMLLGAILLAWAWVDYLRLDGVTIHHLAEEFKDMGKKKKRHATKSIVDYADERIVSFEELEPEERVFCSLLSNLVLGVPLVVISLIAGAM